MTVYSNFIGIDIGKFSFTVATYNSNSTKEYENNSQGIDLFLKEYEKFLDSGLCILEPTGGHEFELLLVLCSHNYAVHRANTRLVKKFIQSLKNAVKTDRLDAMALARYGYERNQQLDLFVPQSTRALELFELTQRRHDLMQLLVSEKNRRQAPRVNFIKHTFDAMIHTINEQIQEITQKINDLIDQDELLKAKKKILKSISGIGNIVANELVVRLPELGQLNRRQIASLVGLAPRANDSGKYRGYRSTGYGRDSVKPMLFMAAMAARNSKSELKIFYERLIQKGKKKMVALVALMRKIIVIANARLKEFDQKKSIAVGSL